MPHNHTVLEEKMQGLKASYLQQVKERHALLDGLLTRCINGTLGGTERSELKAQAHKLAGTGATYGFPDISQKARMLEESLIDYPDNESAFFIEQTRALIAACDAAIASAPVHEAAPATHPAKAAAQQADLPLLLVVDDDEQIHIMLKALFQDDARILCATNSQDALAHMHTQKPDLVLLDDKMLGGDSGLRMLEERRQMPEIRDIPIVMLTASVHPQEVMRGLIAGAADYITKPFNPDEVAAKVRSRLKRQNRIILIADDDEAVRELLSHKFQAAGCKVVCAQDGAQAWELLLKQSFGLVVLDRMMPGYDGMTLLRMMQERPDLARIPVVFLTARHYGSDVLEGLNTGAADYITKPFHPDEVVTRCIKLLDRGSEA